MWFKNLQLYRLVRPFDLSATELSERLAAHAFTPCGSMDPASRGWVPPLGQESGEFVRAAGGRLFLTLRMEERLLPASVVRQTAAERIAQIEAQEARKLGAKAKRDIRERVAEELLPRAFTRQRHLYAYVDPASGWLVVDAGSPKRAAELTEALIKAVDDLHVRPVQAKESPVALMTEWVNSGDAPANFTIDTECELVDEGAEGAKVRLSRQNLEAPEVRGHLAAGKRVAKLGLTWHDRIAFILDGQMQVKRLGFLDILQEEAANAGAESTEAQFDADFAIMAGELSRFLPALLDALGGEAEA